MGIGSNIRALREKYDLTQDQLAEKLGVTRESVHRWETDKMTVRDRHISKMIELFGIEPEDIKSERYGLASQLSGCAPTMPDGAMLPSDARPAYAPLLGRVHAGDACEPDVIDDRIPIPYEVREAHPCGYFLEVEGGCMSRVYPEGCHIYIDPAQQPRNGSVAVVSIDGADYVMRRLYNTGRTVVLSPDSWDDCYEDIVITVEDGRTVEYVGTVVWFQPAEEME